MRKRLGARPKPHLRAKVVSTPFALTTALAAHTDLHGDSVADFERRARGLVGSNGGDDSAGFVAQDERFLDFENSVSAVVVVVR